MPAVRFLPVLAFVCLSSLAAAQSEWESSIVYEGDNGRLVYVTDAEGNRIPDFSHAGYRGGGVPLPDVGTRFTLSPGDGDDTARIQTLLDFLGTQSPNADGFRGALELSAGEYQIDGTLVLRRSGVVLRGAGDGDDPATNTILRRSGTRADPVVLLGPVAEAGTGTLTRRDATRDTSLIRDDVVPIGARSFEIERPEVFSVGDAVTVFHPATKTWLAAIDGGGTAEDAPWGVGQHPIALARTVTGLDGHRMTLDAPTFTRLDAHLSPSYVYHRDRSRTIENVGVENLRVHIETAGPTSETHAKDAIRFVLVENGWASGVTALHFWRAGISVQHSRYVTVAASAALEPHSQVTGARRYNFEVSQSQLVLFIGNRATDARHAYVGNGTSYDSGIVFLDNVSEDAFTSSESHRQWGSGFLWDRHVERGTSGSGSGVAARRLHIGNRGDFGTSHGWACANCVIWNAEMNGSSAVIEKPPTAQNYGIGIQGEALDSGPFVSNTGSFIEGTFRPGLAPGSLYLRQLQDRLAATSIEPPGTSDPIALYPVVPNPLRESGFTRFELLEVAVVRVSVYDALGREVLRLEDGWRAAGSHDVEIEARDLAPGVYTLRLVSSGATATRRFTRLP